MFGSKEEMLEYYKQAFQHADLDGDGFVTIQEFNHAAGHLGRMDMLVFEQAFNQDQDKKLSFDELIKVLKV